MSSADQPWSVSRAISRRSCARWCSVLWIFPVIRYSSCFMFSERCSNEGALRCVRHDGVHGCGLVGVEGVENAVNVVVAHRAQLREHS